MLCISRWTEVLLGCAADTGWATGASPRAHEEGLLFGAPSAGSPPPPAGAKTGQPDAL